MPRYISASGEAVQLARLQIARDSFQIAQYGSDVWPREIGRISSHIEGAQPMVSAIQLSPAMCNPSM